MAVPEGNIYDEQGTILYRVISSEAHALEQSGAVSTAADVLAANSAAAAARSGSAKPGAPTPAASVAGASGTNAGPSGGGGGLAKVRSIPFSQTNTSMSVKYGPDALWASNSAGSKKRTGRLAPIGGTGAAGAAAGAAGNTAADQLGLHNTTTTGGGGGAGTAGAGGEAGAGASGAPNQFAHNMTAEKALAALIPPKSLDDFGDSGNSDSKKESPSKRDGAAATGLANSSGDPLGGDAAQSRRRSAASSVAGSRKGGGAASTTVAPEWVVVPAVDHVSRLDVVLLQQHLQRRCERESARPRGVLCPTREAIFNDGMRELMRQITILCPERGLLLNDLCQRMDQATATYDILFDSASQYAVRKSTERDLRQHLFEERRALESEVRRLENRVNELKAKYQGMVKRFEEQQELAAKLNEEEIAYVKKANAQLVSEIKRFTAMEAAHS